MDTVTTHRKHGPPSKYKRCFPVHPMKAYSGSGGITPLILSPALDKSEWLASRPSRLTPQERTPLPSYYAPGRVPEAVWTMWRRENSLTLAVESNPGSSSP